jgi:hypothetical protein
MSEDPDVVFLRDTATVLRQKFDTVQIFCTRHNDMTNETISIRHGEGNGYARLGQVAKWVETEMANEEEGE